jgi:hypothetical protein
MRVPGGESRLEYADPRRAEPRRRLTPAGKWAVIVVGLCVGAVVIFVVAAVGYWVSLGPMGH